MTGAVVVREPARTRSMGHATPSSRRPLGGFPQPSPGGNFWEFTSLDSLASMPFDDLRRHVTHSPAPSYPDTRAFPAHTRSVNPNVNRSPLPSQFANLPMPQTTRPATPQYSYEVRSRFSAFWIIFHNIKYHVADTAFSQQQRTVCRACIFRGRSPNSLI